MSEENIIGKLEFIIETLKRIEARQIRTTKLVEEVEKAEEAQQVGSFATTDLGTHERTGH